MATTKFDVKEGIRIVLPQAADDSSGEAQSLTLTENEMTRLQIIEDGSISVNNEAPRFFEIGELDALIQRKLRVNQQMIFRVITNREATYNDMIRVVDRLKAADIEKISLSTN